MQEQLADLRQWWFLLWLTDPLSAFPNNKEKGGKKPHCVLSSPPSKKKNKVPRINQVTKNYFWKERWTVTRKKTKQNICFVSKTIHLALYVGCTDREKPEYINHTFLLGSQFPYVHDQPLAVVLVVNRLHLHHCGLDPGFILSDKQ